MSKTSYVGVNNVARQCKSIYVGVNNTARKVTRAYIGDNNGKARLWWDESGIMASDLPIGQIVKLMEGGVETEFIVVNQGIPENSSLYDASCNGTWLLRKDIKEERVWDSNNNNVYETSEVNTWLNGDYFSSLGTVEQGLIKWVKIPYRKDGGYYGTDQSGANGLSAKIFLLSGYEVGWTTSDIPFSPQDGVKLSYFESGTGTSANNKRIVNLNGSAIYWWLRSPATNSPSGVWLVLSDGNSDFYGARRSYGIRPALVLPFTAKFNSETKVLVGG